MEERDAIHHYLKSLSKYLARLDKADAQEVLREIESHIFDAMEQQQNEGKAADAATLLEGFGTPRELAAQYVEHILAGSPPPPGFKAIQRVKKGVTASLYYAMAAFGVAIATSLMFVAGAKLLVPSWVGVWSAAEGNSLAIGFLSDPYPQEQELLGYWLVPVAALLSLLVAELTRRVLRVIKTAM